MADIETSRPTLVDELASLDPEARRELATILRQVSQTFAEVPDGQTASHVLGVKPNRTHTHPDLHQHIIIGLQ